MYYKIDLPHENSPNHPHPPFLSTWTYCFRRRREAYQQKHNFNNNFTPPAVFIKKIATMKLCLFKNKAIEKD